MSDPPSTPVQPAPAAALDSAETHAVASADGGAHHSILPGRRHNAALGFIFVTVLMDMLAIGIIAPVLPNLVKHFTGGDAGAAADYVGVFGAVWALMQFVFSPVQGALSDHFGRRPVLLMSVFGLSADYVLMALSPNLAWLFVGRVISGVTAASFSTANAYIADITPPENRAASFGLMGAAFGIGFIIGPAVGGVFGRFDPRLPFWIAAGLAFLNGLYGLFILPESLPKARRAPFKLANASPIGSLNLLLAHDGLLQLGCVLFLYMLGFQALQSTTVLYTGYRYGWSSDQMGLMLAGIGGCNILVQAGVVKPFVKRFGERGALLTGLVFGAAAMAIYGLAPNGWLFWVGVPVYSLTGLIQPGVQGMMTRRIGPKEQGRLQGANSSIMAMTGLIGPLLFTQLFHRLVAGHGRYLLSGAPYYLAALLFVASMALALSTRKAAQAEALAVAGA